MKVTRIAYSDELNPGKFAALEEQAARLLLSVRKYGNGSDPYLGLEEETALFVINGCGIRSLSR